jgi:zinc transporter ZupT
MLVRYAVIIANCPSGMLDTSVMHRSWMSWQIFCCACTLGASNQALGSVSSFGLTHQRGQPAGSLPLPRIA